MSEQDFTKPGLQPTPGTSPAPKSSGLKTFIVFTVILLVLAGLGWLIHYRLANATTKPGGGVGRGGGDLTVPVIAGHVAHKDGPILIHAECVGGDLDLLLNQRAQIGCFPWRFVDGESSIARIVAFVEDKRYEELMAKKKKAKLTKFGDVAGAKNAWLHEEAKKTK